ncbi:MAG: NADH-quinone oxidoreductase subunit NuoE [Bacteroidetes bacterium HGW-Bacteroidetes-6]|jgi:NADH-quinone oxidoreductase subunit E|nr:MAG: NADH-quinone oxidoreductase subunit NuoE [Bacteroidetes bacterium HGW-Bacteroidetes-6]
MRIERIIPSVDAAESQDIDLLLIEPVLKKYIGYKGATIPVLQGIQNIFGYVPRLAIFRAAQVLNMNVADIYGVATFYAQFRLAPVGKHIIKVCHGTACHVQNATAISEAIEEALEINDGETTPDGMFTLESVACLGCCSLAPVMMIGDDTFGKLTGKSAVKIVNDIKMKEKQL